MWMLNGLLFSDAVPPRPEEEEEEKHACGAWCKQELKGEEGEGGMGVGGGERER